MLAIRDIMRLVPNDVSTLALGIACSAGQFLLSAGTPGKRRALPRSRILLHQGSAGIGGTAVDVELQADDLRHTRDTVLDLIAGDTGRPRAHRLPRRTHREQPMSTYPIPNVIAQHPRGERVLDVYSHLLAERIIYLGTAIDAGVANALIAQLIHLESVDPDRDVQLYVNCEGGDPSAMLAVHDTMRYIRPDVATTCVGQAISVGAVLLAAGAPGRRAALSHARVVPAPALRAGARTDPRTSSSRRTSSCGSGPTSRGCSRGRRAARSPSCARTPTGTGSSPRLPHGTTGSSTR